MELRISIVEGDTVIALRQGESSWTTNLQLHACSDAQLHDLFGARVDAMKAEGLCGDPAPVVVVSMKPGSILGADTIETGYFAFMLLGGSELYRK